MRELKALQAELAVATRIRAERLPGMVVVRHTARRAVRSGALWGYVFGIFVASSALSYSTIYKTRAERDRLAASFGSNHAASALVRACAAVADRRRIHRVQGLDDPDDHRRRVGVAHRAPGCFAARRTRGAGSCCFAARPRGATPSCRRLAV